MPASRRRVFEKLKALALKKNVPLALGELDVAAPFETGNADGGFYSWSALYPVYVRGELYLSANRASEGGAEFEKVLRYRRVALYEPISALSHLGSARSYVEQGNYEKARIAYEDFLTLHQPTEM